MHDYENHDTFNGADGVPTFFAIYDPLYKRHAAGIVENELRGFKVDTVFGPVRLVLGAVPLDPHAYLQYRKYGRMKSSAASAVYPRHDGLPGQGGSLRAGPRARGPGGPPRWGMGSLVNGANGRILLGLGPIIGFVPKFLWAR
jgi:hypothetical protein